jgi:hypothetical protein
MQPTLFDKPRRAHARSTDPATSHAAAASLPDLRASEIEVLGLFAHVGSRLTDEQLIARARAAGLTQSDSGLRTRRSELVDLAYVQDSGVRELTATGRRTISWQRIR